MSHPTSTPGPRTTAPALPHRSGRRPPCAPAHRAPARPALGDGALRVGMLVLGLLTAGNILLAWLDAAG